MADNGSQPGTSAGSGNVINYMYGSPIGIFNQHNHFTSTSCTKIEIDYCPAPVSTFLGRYEELGTLKTLLTQHQVVALVGMGGLGKTQLSRKYVQVNKTDYKYKYWLESETPEKLKNSFKKFAKKLHVESDNIDDEVVNDVYKKIQTISTILVFDNVENPADVYAYLPTRVDLPSGVTIHVLITSRWAEWACDEQIQCYKLQPLDISACLQIFQRKFGETCIDTMQDEWEELAEILGYLPLALQVATSYIYKRNKHNSDLPMVLADYIKQLRKEADGLLNDPLTEYGNRSVYTSMLLTLERLENKTDDKWKFAVTLINAAAYMNPDRIIKERLSQLLDNNDNPCRLDEALVILTEYSLINRVVGWRNYAYYTVHRIIQTSIRHNQAVKGTADLYYTGLLKYALAGDYQDVLQYANERVSAIVNYYKKNPSPTSLRYLVECKAITAVQAVFQVMARNQVQSLIEQQDLLYWAVESKNLSMVQFLCSHCADINQLSREEGEPPLHHALRLGNMEIATWLLENGAAPTQRDWEGRNALHVAIQWAKHQMVSIIIKTDRSAVNEADSFGQTPLHIIDYSENEKDILPTIRVLAESGADITAVDMWCNTVLHCAAREACAAAVSLIFQLNKYLINEVNEDGETALHVIPYNDTNIYDERIISIILVLVESGVDLTKVDLRGNTVLHLAARGARASTVLLILQLNKDLIDIKNEDGETALHVIPYDDIYMDDERIISIIRVLVESGVDLTKVDLFGNTVVHSAAMGARAEAVSLILQLNKDLINIVNKYGKTALHVIPYDNTLIDYERILSTIRVLVENGVDLTKVDLLGNTVVHSAAMGVRAEAVSIILHLNKDLINIVNKYGETALHVLGNGFDDKFKYLREEDRKKLFARMKETARVLIMNDLSLDTVEPEYKNKFRLVTDELLLQEKANIISYWCNQGNIKELCDRCPYQ